MSASKATGRPEVVVVAIITDGAGRLLLSRRTEPPASGKWHTPGGSLNFGESLEIGLAREIREELGVDIKVLDEQPSATTQTVFPDVDRHVVALHYRARIVRGMPRPLDGTSKVHFFTKRGVGPLVEKDLLLDSCRGAIRRILGWTNI